MDQETNPVAQPFVELAPGTIASDFALKNLNKALGTAQVEFLPAVKAEENKYAGYKYTPLENIIGACRAALTKNHLTVSQFPVTDLHDKTIAVYSRLVHWDSGEWLQNMLELPAELALGKDGALKFNQQTIGGCQTYAQKYSYKAILGIPDAEEIVDGSDKETGNLDARKKQPAENWKAHQQNVAKGPSETPTTMEGNILTGTVKEIRKFEKPGKNPGRQIMLADPITIPGAAKPFDCVWVWHQTMFEDLDAMPGKQCEFMVATTEKGITLNTILMVGSIPWGDVDDQTQQPPEQQGGAQ